MEQIQKGLGGNPRAVDVLLGQDQTPRGLKRLGTQNLLLSNPTTLFFQSLLSYKPESLLEEVINSPSTLLT